MNKHLLISLMVTSVLSISGQTNYLPDPATTKQICVANMECIYKYTISPPGLNKKDTTKMRTQKYRTILQTNGVVSSYRDWHTFKMDSCLFTQGKQFITKEFSDSLDKKYDKSVQDLITDVVLKNYPEGYLTVTDNIGINDYTYQQKKTDYNWTLADDTLTVCGYVCNKATTSFGGRNWTVWYAPDISLSDGPWKFYGLPGLILKANDSNGYHSFEAVTIRKSNLPVYITKNTLLIKTDKAQFLKLKSQYAANPEQPPVQSIKSFAIDKKIGRFFMNGKRTLLKPDIGFCPLEIE